MYTKPCLLRRRAFCFAMRCAIVYKAHQRRKMPGALTGTLKYSLATSDGMNRTYWVRVPTADASDERPLALVVAVHGYTRDGLTMIKALGPVLNRRNFIIAAPDGFNHSFNGIECCGAAVDLKIDDGKFVSELVRDYWQRNPDAAQMPGAFLTGFSNGGYLSSFIAMRHASGERGFEWLKAVAPIGGHLSADAHFPKRLASKPLPLLVSHGVRDTIVRFGGCCRAASATCCCNISERSPNECRSVPVLFERWQKLNGCDQGEPRGQCVTQRCAEGVEAHLCVHAQEGHVLSSAVKSELGDFFTMVAKRLLRSTSSPSLSIVAEAAPEPEPETPEDVANAQEAEAMALAADLGVFDTFQRLKAPQAMHQDYVYGAVAVLLLLAGAAFAYRRLRAARRTRAE